MDRAYLRHTKRKEPREQVEELGSILELLKNYIDVKYSYLNPGLRKYKGRF